MNSTRDEGIKPYAERVGLYTGSDGGHSTGLIDRVCNDLEKGNVSKRDGIALLNTTLAAMQIAEICALEGYQIITGGYLEGAVGCANEAAYKIALSDNRPLPVGVTFPALFPDDETVVNGIHYPADTMAERLLHYQSFPSKQIIVGFGGPGLLSEIAMVIEANKFALELPQAVRNSGNRAFDLKRIIIVDPTGRTIELLTEFFTNFINSSRLNSDITQKLLKSIYLIGPGYFEPTENPNYPKGVMELSLRGECLVSNLLDERADSRFTFHQFLSNREVAESP